MMIQSCSSPLLILIGDSSMLLQVMSDFMILLLTAAFLLRVTHVCHSLLSLITSFLCCSSLPFLIPLLITILHCYFSLVLLVNIYFCFSLLRIHYYFFLFLPKNKERLVIMLVLCVMTYFSVRWQSAKFDLHSLSVMAYIGLH